MLIHRVYERSCILSLGAVIAGCYARDTEGLECAYDSDCLGLRCIGRLCSATEEKTGAVSVAVGSEQACAVLGDGTARCWGANTWGQLGYPDLAPAACGAAPKVLGPINLGAGADGANVLQIATGGGIFDEGDRYRAHTCALLEGGRLKCLPTGWASSTSCGAGITREVVAKGTLANGLNYLDIRIYGTNGSGIQCYPDIYFVGNSVPASVGQNYTFSVYAQMIAAASTGFANVPYVCSSEANSSGNYLTSSCGSAVASTFMRRWTARTFGNASVGYARAYVYLPIPNGNTVDVTYRFAAPQIERALTPTSYIPTTRGAVTRSSDVLTIPTGGWYNTAAGAFMVVGDNPYMGGSGKSYCKKNYESNN